MREQLLALYIAQHAFRRALYGAMLLLAFSYGIFNNLVLRRPTDVVTREVVILIVFMTALLPAVYSFGLKWPKAVPRLLLGTREPMAVRSLAEPDYTLARQQVAEIEARIESIGSEIRSTSLEYEVLTSLTPNVKGSVDTRPHAYYDHELRAKAYRAGSLTAMALAVLTFAAMGVGSLNIGASPVVVFAGCSILAVFLCICASIALAFAVGANPRNPSSELTLRRLTVGSGLVAALCTALLFVGRTGPWWSTDVLDLRSAVDHPAAPILLAALVAFEISLILLGASLEAAHDLYSWSGALEKRYKALEALRWELIRKRSAALTVLDHTDGTVPQAARGQEIGGLRSSP